MRVNGVWKHLTVSIFDLSQSSGYNIQVRSVVHCTCESARLRNLGFNICRQISCGVFNKRKQWNICGCKWFTLEEEYISMIVRARRHQSLNINATLTQNLRKYVVYVINISPIEVERSSSYRSSIRSKNNLGKCQNLASPFAVLCWHNNGCIVFKKYKMRAVFT